MNSVASPVRESLRQLGTIRELRGNNQRQLALRAGVPQQTISQMERGMAPPDDDLVGRLAEALCVPALALYSERIMVLIDYRIGVLQITPAGDSSNV